MLSKPLIRGAQAPRIPQHLLVTPIREFLRVLLNAIQAFHQTENLDLIPMIVLFLSHHLPEQLPKMETYLATNMLDEVG